MPTLGKGTTVGHADTAGGTYTTLSGVLSVSYPGSTVAKVDTTHYGSADSTIEGMSAVWQEWKELQIECHYDKTQTAALEALKGVHKYWKITKADGSTWVGPGFISDTGGEIPNRSKINSTYQVTPIGKFTFTAAA